MARWREVLCARADDAVVDTPAVDTCAVGRMAPFAQRREGGAKANERLLKQPGSVPLQNARDQKRFVAKSCYFFHFELCIFDDPVTDPPTRGSKVNRYKRRHGSSLSTLKDGDAPWWYML